MTIGAALGASLERAEDRLKAKQLTEDPRWPDALPTRAVTFLRKHGLDALAEVEAMQAVAQFSRRELLEQPNFGRGAYEALVAWLAGHGLTLRRQDRNRKGRSREEAPF